MKFTARANNRRRTVRYYETQDRTVGCVLQHEAGKALPAAADTEQNAPGLMHPAIPESSSIPRSLFTLCLSHTLGSHLPPSIRQLFFHHNRPFFTFFFFFIFSFRSLARPSTVPKSPSTSPYGTPPGSSAFPLRHSSFPIERHLDERERERKTVGEDTSAVPYTEKLEPSPIYADRRVIIVWWKKQTQCAICHRFRYTYLCTIRLCFG